MIRPAPNVPSVNTNQPITAALWNQFVYAVGFHTRAPSALLYQNTAQAVPSTTPTRIAFDSAVKDTDAGHDPTSNSSRYTISTPGTYQVTVIGSMDGFSTAGGERSVAITVNEAAYWGLQLLAPDPNGLWYYGCCCADIPLNSGDFVEAQLWQDSGTTFNTQAGNTTGSWMGLHWVGT